MKLHEPPNCFTKTVEFSAAVVDYVDSEETQSRIYPLLGGLSRDNHYAWISRGPKFEVVAADSGAKVAAWTFGGILKDTNTKVTCAVELPTVENGYGTSVSCLYAVGLDCYMSPGMVCLFDIRGSKIIKAIQVPGKVTSLALVDPGLIPEATTPLAPPLRLARGVLAVGLSPGGQVLLLDLCLSEEDGVVNEGSPLGEEEYMCGTARPHLEHSDELNPSIVVVHAPGDPGTEGPVAPGEHLAIFLNEQSFVNNYFMLKLSESPSSIYRLPLSHVDITASLYVPQLASLFIGFSFGCFQVWDLGNLSLVHTSSLMAEPRNVTFFAFQEPADDPRKYCYIWAVYGRKWDKGIKDGEGRRSGSSSEPSEREGEDDLAFACMHDMYYHSKEWIDAYGWIYQDFVSMHRRFELELSLGDAARTISRCISCFSLDGNLGRDRAPYLRRLETAEFDEVSSAENDLSLCCLVWQSWQVAEDGTPCNLQHSLTVFDLNQWYREQMPSGASSLMLFSSDLNGDCLSQGVSSHPGHPHLVTYTLPFVTEKTMSANGIPLLFARINPTSISRFCPAAVPIPEEHLFPSALAFESSFLLGSKCVIKMSTPGLQRSLLAILRNRGSRTYLYPSALFHECITAGLKPLYVDIHNPASTPVAEQRKFLLSLALEYHMLSYLIRCAVDTANGCASSLGVTLSFFMSWVKHRSSVIRECINELSKPLFECGGTLLPDPQAARLMGLCGRQLKHLSTLLKEILKRCVSWIFVDELKEIEQWCEVLGILALHIQVVQWFCYVGLLPELADEDSAAAEIEASNIGAPRIPYPAKVLTAIYEERRKVLRSIPGVSNVSDILFIDGAVQACGVRLTQETWRISGSDTSGSYPPPSLQALLRTYLLDGLPVEDKHCLVIYLFLDLAALLDNERYASSISQLIKFPSAFSLSPSIIKLTQAFWLLDHKDFESAINMFLEPLICPQDIKLWQHRCVVRAFLSQGEPQKALKYVRVRQPPLGGLEDLKLNLTLLLENGLVHEAFNYQRKHRNNQNSHELLQHFFDGCGDLKELRWVLQNSLTPPEEEGLVSFLTSQKDAKAHEMLVMYYLQRSRFIEALSINDKERPSKKNEFPRGAIDTTRRKMKTVRDAIVSGYASAMPPVTRHLAAYCARHAANIRSWREVPKPIPLSVVINRAKLDPSAMSVRTKSTLIGTMLNKARETWNPPPLPPLMPPTPRPSLRTPQPPLSMQSSRSKRKREDEEGSETSQLTAKNLFNSPARSSVDLIPFICTPVAPSLPRSRNGDGQPLIFPSQMKSLSNLEDGTPSKRPCTSSSSQAPTTSSPIENDETSLRSSALQLLLTPVVPKKNRKADGMDGLLNDDYSSTGTEGSTPPREKLPRTPHSILKVRKTRDMTAESPSFATDYYQEEENEGVHEEDEGQSLGRLIRFQLPTGLTPSPTMASPIQWPTHSRGDRSGSERELKVPTSKSPLSRSPIKELVKTRVQPSPRTRPSPRTPIQPSPRSSIQPSPRPSIQPSPAKKSSLTPVRREFVSSTKTTTKVKTVRESFVEDELERVTERKGPRTRSSIHVNEKLPLKRKLQAEASSDESGEFHSFEEPKNVETVEEEGVGSSPAEGKRGTIILTDSYIKLFGSPYQESKRLRPSLLFKDDEEEVDDEMEENEEEEEGLPQEIEGIEATEPATLESKDPERQEAVALDEESEKVADEELMEDEVEVGEIVDKSKPRLLEIPVHDDYLAKEEKVEDEVALEGEKVSEVPQEVERTEADVKRGIHEVEEADADGPPSLVALPLEKVMKSEGKAVVEGERGEGEVGIYESSAGDVNATVEKQHGMFRLDTRETSLDEMVEEGTNRLSTVEEVASIVEKEEEKKYAMGEINEGQDIREGMKSQEVAEEEAKAKAGGVEADEDETEGDGKGEDDQELDASGKSVEELSPEVAEQGERRDEESEGEGEEPEDDDDVVVISSTEEDEEEEEDEEGQSGRESVGDKAAEAHGGDSPWGPMLGETEEEKEYWGEYEYEEEMEGYDGNRGEGHSGSQEEEEEELENENPRKTWITKWEKESGENNELGVGEEEGDEGEEEEGEEGEYMGSEEVENLGDEGRALDDRAGLEVVGVQIGVSNKGKSTKSLIKQWEEEYGIKEEHLGENFGWNDGEEVDDEVEEVDDEVEEVGAEVEEVDDDDEEEGDDDEEIDEDEDDDDDEEEEDDDDDDDDDSEEEEDEEEEEEDDDGIVELVDEVPVRAMKAGVVTKEVQLPTPDRKVPATEEESAEEAEEPPSLVLSSDSDHPPAESPVMVTAPKKVEEKQVEVEAGDGKDAVEVPDKETVVPLSKENEEIEEIWAGGDDDVVKEETKDEMSSTPAEEHEEVEEERVEAVEGENKDVEDNFVELESRMEVGDSIVEEDVVLLEEKFDVFKKKTKRDKMYESAPSVSAAGQSKQLFTGGERVTNIIRDSVKPRTVPGQISVNSVEVEEVKKEGERADLGVSEGAVGSIVEDVVKPDAEPVEISKEIEDRGVVRKDEERVVLVESEERMEKVAEVVELDTESMEIADKEEVMSEEEKIQKESSKGTLKSIVAEAIELDTEPVETSAGVAEVKEIGEIDTPLSVEGHEAERMEEAQVVVLTKSAEDVEMKVEATGIKETSGPEGDVQAVDVGELKHSKELEKAEEEEVKHADVDRIILVNEEAEVFEGKGFEEVDKREASPVPVKPVEVQEQQSIEGTKAAELDSEANSEGLMLDKSEATAVATDSKLKESKVLDSKEPELIRPAEKENSEAVTVLQPQPSHDRMPTNENKQDHEILLVKDSDNEEDTSKQEDKEVDVPLVESSTLTVVSSNENYVRKTSKTQGEQVVTVINESPNQIPDSSIEEVTPKAGEVKGGDVLKVERTPTQIIEETAETGEEMPEEIREKLEDSVETPSEEKSEVEEMNLSAKIEEYATSRRLTRHQMSLLSRSLGGTESPSTPMSAKKKTKAKTPPRAVKKDAPATPVPMEISHNTSLPTTPLRSSARIRDIGGKVPSDKSAVAQETSHQQESVPKSTINPEERAPSEVAEELPVKTLDESTKAPQDEESSSPWTLSLEGRLKKLKKGSTSTSPSARKTRKSSGKSASSHGSVSSPTRERTMSETKSMDKDTTEGRTENEPHETAVGASALPESPSIAERLRHHSPMVSASPAARRSRRLSTKSSSPHSSASTEIRLSPIPRAVAQSEDAAAAWLSSPTHSVASTVESTRSGRAPRRRRSTRVGADQETGVPQGGKSMEEEAKEVDSVALLRAVSPTPSVASTVGSCASGRVLRKSMRTRASMEREEPPLTPTQELQRSGRVRRRSETGSPATRRSARLRGGSPLTAEALSHERSSPPNDSDSEVSGYSSSVASSRSRLSAAQEDRVEELTLRSGRKRAKPPAVTPTKSGPRKSTRGGRSARFLRLTEENEEEEGVPSVDTSFVFSPPKQVHSDPSVLDVPKETMEFTLSPPKVVPHSSVVTTGRQRPMAARYHSAASLAAIPEHSEIAPSTSPGEEAHEETMDDIVQATPPRRRGRSSLAGSKMSLKAIEALWSSPRRGVQRGKSKGKPVPEVEEPAIEDKEVALSLKKRTRRSSAGSLQPIEEIKDEEDSSEGAGAQKGLHPILRKKGSSPTGSVVSESALDQGVDIELEDKDANRAKDDSDALPKKRKSSSRKKPQPRRVIVPYKPRKSAKL